MTRSDEWRVMLLRSESQKFKESGKGVRDWFRKQKASRPGSWAEIAAR